MANPLASLGAQSIFLVQLLVRLHKEQHGCDQENAFVYIHDVDFEEVVLKMHLLKVTHNHREYTHLFFLGCGS